MTAIEPQPAAPKPSLRWYHPTPDRLILGLLALEGLLRLSERSRWLPWHKGYAVLIAVASVGVFFLLMLLWYLAALLFRLRFQFSIRSLLVLTVAVAVPCSWLSWEMKRAREQRKTVESFTELTGAAGHEWECDKHGNFILDVRPPEPAWLRSWLGEDFFGEVVIAALQRTEVTDIGLAELRRFKHLRWLRLLLTETTDAGLAQIATLTELKGLSLGNTRVTDVGLAHVAALTQLEELDLEDTQVTDAGLTEVAGLAQIRELFLGRTQVTDTGLAHIAGLTQLDTLALNGTGITDAGLAHLSRLAHLRWLWLNDTQVEGVGLTQLAGLTELQVLRLDGTQVTDTGLAHAARLTQLQWLSLAGTRVSDAGVAKLRKALPNCQILH
ncbi:MAG: hypothetical protein ABR915_23130 [Thermoguttaceae bacterium]|jgi:hypothetical protein